MAGFRFGHSMITDVVERYNKFHHKLESFRMSSLILQPFIMYKPGIIDSLILGLLNQESNRFDPQISTEVKILDFNRNEEKIINSLIRE